MVVLMMVMTRVMAIPRCVYVVLVRYVMLHVVNQTPSTGLRHPPFGGRCRKAMLGVW